MTTTLTGTAIVYPDGTAQSTAAFAVPDAAENVAGTVIYAVGGEVRDKWNNSKYITNDSLAAAQIFGAGGQGQYYQNVTGSRSANVTYTNTTGRGIMVSITSVHSGHYTYAGLIVNGVQVCHTGGDQDNGGATVMAVALVPPGQTYSANTSFSAWYELR